MTIHTFEQNSPEWHSIRLGKLTASHAQAIGNGLTKTGKIGAGLETLCFTKAAEILSGASEDNYTSPDMERGNELEALARSAYEMETGRQVTVVGFCELDEYVGASPDGLVDEDGLVEFKCQKNSVYLRTLYSQKIDTKYVWQMQQQMYVTGRKWCDFVVFNENFTDLIIIRVERDEEAIEKIKAGLDIGKARIKEIVEKCKKNKKNNER